MVLVAFGPGLGWAWGGLTPAPVQHPLLPAYNSPTLGLQPQGSTTCADSPANPAPPDWSRPGPQLLKAPWDDTSWHISALGISPHVGFPETVSSVRTGSAGECPEPGLGSATNQVLIYTYNRIKSGSSTGSGGGKEGGREVEVTP